MKLLIAFLIIGCLAVTNVYSLDQETKKLIIYIYNSTRNQYIIIMGLVDDLSDSKIKIDLAEKKLREWETLYREKTESVPREARKMCELMNEVIDVTQELVRDYQPNYQTTKDLLNELNKVEAKLIREMNELKYIIQ